MKKVRKWSRILHRDFGYLFFGVTLVYSLSGIALNHIGDWNPNYSVEIKEFKSQLSFKKSDELKTNIMLLLDEIANRKEYKKHYFPNKTQLKIFLSGGSSIVIDIDSGEGYAEFLKRRPLFYHMNYLHYNPNNWWKWFSDIFAIVLILLAITGLIMVRGPKGIKGRGAWLTSIGIIIPIIFLIIG